MGEGTLPEPSSVSPRVLLIDDDAELLEFYQDSLAPLGYHLETAADGAEAAFLLSAKRYDVVVSDIVMPALDGLELLRMVRSTNLDVPVVLVTGTPSTETAIRAIELGALRYLLKPFSAADLRRVVSYGVCVGKMAGHKREALKMISGLEGFASDRAGLELTFERALASVTMHYQPIVSWSRKNVYGYEALARTNDPSLSSPLALIETAERLGRLPQLGRHLRRVVAATLDGLPRETNVFVNVHPRDLEDDDLLSSSSPLARDARRIVLEITERASLEAFPDAPRQLSALRHLGYRIAIDDVGAGHAGLSTFTRLEPDIAKLDMALIRDVDTSTTKQAVIRSMAELFGRLGVLVITEGVETARERDALLGAGCDFLQGYLFGRPTERLQDPTW